MPVQHALRIEEYDADDTAAVDGGRVVLNAANALDAPFLPPQTLHRRTMDVRHGWDQSPERHLLACVDGEPVAMADVELGEWDNLDVSWFYLVVHPDHRLQGHGGALLEHVLDLSRAAGRTKFGASWWESASTEAFAARHGFARASQDIHRVVRPRELPAGFVEQAVAEAAPHAGDYELVRVPGRAPESLLPAVSEITTAINDAPLDDLDIEDELFPVERIRGYQNASIESGYRLYRILARHRRTGAPAGHTVVVVDAETPALAHQHDTAVMGEHRGHRLGLLLKAEMMRWLAEVEPQVESIDTWNAESNDHMIAVNERLRYRALGRELAFQTRA